jgi:hemerythrin
MINGNKDQYFSLKSVLEHHNALVTIVHEIISMKSKNADNRLLMNNITKMDDFIMEHFMYEEELMVKYSYLGMEVHKQQHNYFRDKLEAFNLYDLARPCEYYEEALGFMVDMLSIHMMQEDVELTIISQKLIQT